jgi:hypothetical protein
MLAESIPNFVKLAEEKRPDILCRPASFRVLNLITEEKDAYVLAFTVLHDAKLQNDSLDCFWAPKTPGVGQEL